MDSVAGDIGAGGQRHLGIDDVGSSRVGPDTPQRPERAAIAVTSLGQPFIEVVLVKALHTRRRQRAGPQPRADQRLTPRWRATSTRRTVATGAGVHAERPPPLLIERLHHDLQIGRRLLRQTSTAVCRTSSSITGQPANSPARRITSMNPVAGNTTVSLTWWPTSQSWVLGDSRPLTMTWSSSASVVDRAQQGMLCTVQAEPALRRRSGRGPASSGGARRGRWAARRCGRGDTGPTTTGCGRDCAAGPARWPGCLGRAGPGAT